MPDDPNPSRRTRMVIAVFVSLAVITFIVVHVTGVIGPGSH